jgi:hypothetical protein
MSDTQEKNAAYLKRNRQLQALVTQRELTQAEKDEWEELVRKMNELQEEIQGEMQSDSQ